MGVTVSQITGNLAACWTACSSWQQTNLYQYFNPLGTHDTTTTKQSTTKPSIHILYRSSDIWQVCLAGLVQEWIISSALAMEILRSCTDLGVSNLQPSDSKCSTITSTWLTDIYCWVSKIVSILKWLESIHTNFGAFGFCFAHALTPMWLNGDWFVDSREHSKRP